MRQSTSDARSPSGETDSEQQAHADTILRGDTDDSDTEHGRDGGGKDGLLLDENILQPYRVSTAKRNRDTPSYFSSCALKGSHISQRWLRGCLRRPWATSRLDGAFLCTAFVTNRTLDFLLGKLEVTDIGWLKKSLRDSCSRRCYGG